MLKRLFKHIKATKTIITYSQESHTYTIYIHAYIYIKIHTEKSKENHNMFNNTFIKATEQSGYLVFKINGHFKWQQITPLYQHL